MTKEEKIARLIEEIDIIIALNEEALHKENKTPPTNIIPFPTIRTPLCSTHSKQTLLN